MNIKHYVYLVIVTVVYIGLLIIVYLVIYNSEGNYSHPNTTPTNNVLFLPTRTTAIKTYKLTSTSSISPTIITMTMTPFITNTNTPLPTITAQKGYEIWYGGSVQGYILQYQIDKWNESKRVLYNNNIDKCELHIGGGSDICMSYNCIHTNMVFGGLPFTRTIVYERLTMYWAHGGYLGYLLYMDNNPWQCRKDAEAVLNTIYKIE